MSAVIGSGNIWDLLPLRHQAVFMKLLDGTALVREVQFFRLHKSKFTILFVMTDEEFCHVFPRHAEELARVGDFSFHSSEELRIEAWTQLMPSFRPWIDGVKESLGRKYVIDDVLFFPANWKTDVALWSKEYYSSNPFRVENIARSEPVLTMLPSR